MARNRKMTRLEADGGDRDLRQARQQRLVVAVGHRPDAQRRTGRGGRLQRLHRGPIAEINQQVNGVGCHHHGPCRSHVVGEISDVGRRRDDQGVETERFQRRTYAGVTRGKLTGGRETHLVIVPLRVDV